MKSQLFKQAIILKISLESLFLILEIIRPPMLKELSIGALVAGICKYLLAIVASIGNLD